jgi:hypothetical protein
MIRKIFSVIVLLIAFKANSQVDYKIKQLLFKDDFSKSLNNWIIEKQKADSEIITTRNGKLLLDTYNGATVWLKQELKGNLLIKMKRTVILQGGKNDRLSDCNFFWMVTDSLQNNMFKRSAGFKEYDSLSMYYVGFGGNYNTTTRFRKYSAKGDKQILGEFKDAAHLLEANKTYSIEIVVKNGLVEFKVNGKIFFNYTDATSLTHGFFGIRSTRSRQEIDDLEIYEIE